MLNLNIALSNFEAEIIILPLATEAKMKNGVDYTKCVLIWFWINIVIKE